MRLLCNSILQNDNVPCADKTIKYERENSVLKLEYGDAIRLDQAGFLRIFHAFFAELESKFL